MILIEKKHFETPLGQKKTYYYDAIDETEYRRIAGGIGFPYGDQPGFLIVMAEDFPEDPRLKKRRIRLLTEYANDDIEKLIKSIYDYQNRYLIETWYGETDNLIMMHFIDKFNQSLSKKKKGLYINDAPFSDDPHNLRLYSHQIKNLLIPTKKALYFGDNSQIPGYLSGLSDDQVRQDQAQKHPIIAALGFLVAGLSEPYYDVSKDREIQEAYIQKRAVAGL